ncbi:MAG: TIGR03960 family B12-binding radical SAM protein [Lachnospiraceae bacterium]|nr:TIGR03960 family B12-binding radical SAM protein [Lachnospiraceae bacterium]
MSQDNLFLSNDILMSVEKPERYIGHEVNSCIKDPDSVRVRFAMCFPDVYEIGMSHLGIQILYDMFNSFDDVWCERVYSPWVDLDKVMREKNIPLFMLESQTPVKNADFLGITIQYEMCYTNILQILDLSGIPLESKDRTDDDPIVIGGGPCTYNPEPIADFFDIFYIGEGETRYRELIDLYEKCKDEGYSRDEFLIKAASIPGLYVPRFYDVEYNEDGTLKSFTPTVPGIPARIRKEVVKNLDDTYYPKKPVVPYIRCIQDRVVLEIMRGCIRGCRFCQAGELYRPIRERSVDKLLETVYQMLDSTGYEEVSLSSLSSSDYTHLPELLENLIEECRKRKVNITLPSLRIDAFSLDVMNKVEDIKKSSVTFAPEAGSQRLRNVINKGLTEEDILSGAGQAIQGGWTKFKFYFMLGHPFENDDDIEGIGDLANKVAAEFFEMVPKEKRTNGPISITVSTSFFVPKPFTAFQWAPQCTQDEFIRKAYVCRGGIAKQLNQKRIHYNWHDADTSVIEALLARGDRKVSAVIKKVYEKGGIYDAWSDYYKHDRWIESIEEAGLSLDFYAFRERGEDELFPWDFIDIGVSKAFLLKEYKKAAKGEITFNCRHKCSGCGAASFGAGICPGVVKSGN